ncbi:MAG: NADP-dependent oxidoreductase [Acidobacteriaceae bacterium]|nr:NADP-dependent oxidoreductase [Acidobacteriaceae bacterium]
MKAVLLHEYGKPGLLKWEEAADPKPGQGEVLVRVQAASVNPVDLKRRSGAAAERFPVQFPGILGRDFAGVIRELGEGVHGFAVGDRVFGLAWDTYAELCVCKADEMAKIPDGVDVSTAAAIPLVSATGDQLVREAAKAQKGDALVISGLTGSVGRCALFTAKELEVKVIAAVRKHAMEEARSLGAVDAIDLEDDKSIALLGFVDAVADTVGREAGTKLIGKVKAGGNYGSIVGVPKNASLHPTVQVNAMMTHPDAKTYVRFAEAIRDGKLVLPIDRVVPMAEAAEAHAAAEKGGIGKIVLTA